MKWISLPLLLLAIVLRLPAADTVTLAWDYTNTAGITGFRVYYGGVPTPAGGTNFVAVGRTNLTATITNIPVGVTAFQATAVASNALSVLESDPSSVVYYTNRNFGAPLNLRITGSSNNTAAIWIDNMGPSTTVQWSPDLSTWKGWAQVKTLDATAPVEKSIFLSGVSPSADARYWRAVADQVSFSPASISPLPAGVRVSPPLPGQ